MRTLRPTWRALAGGAVGAAAAAAAVLLARAAGTTTPFTVVLVLMVAIVGLGLGAASALYAYAAAGVITIAMTTVPATSGLTLVDIVRFGAFVLGSPLVVLLALRADRQQLATREARDAIAASGRRIDAEREEAVAARLETDLALRQAEQARSRLEEVAEAIPEPLVVYDANGVGSYANRAALRLLGRSFFDRSPEDWARAAEPRDERGGALLRAEWPQIAAQEAPVRRRLLVRLPMSGRDLLVNVEGTPVHGGGCVLLLRDVSREEDERRRLSRFASFVAHELRNPLAVARARIELAEREPDIPERAAAHDMRALESVEAAIAILERLEMFSRADAGMVEAQEAPFDVAVALAAAIERLRARGSERRVRVRSKGPMHALGDRYLTEQAITNLLTNADRYSTPGAPIVVEIADGDGVVVRVRDSGPGIADNVAERLFRDRVAVGRGLGLGLYLVRAMMEAQGGTVQLEQRAPQAVFTLRLRRVPSETADGS
jgi:signal transduction histidine kinase